MNLLKEMSYGGGGGSEPTQPSLGTSYIVFSELNAAISAWHCVAYIGPYNNYSSVCVQPY